MLAAAVVAYSPTSTLNTKDHGISVLMPVHNGGQYLHAAVDSIIEQTHHKLELIIIDDHSTDRAIQSLNPNERLRIIESPNKGIVPALNAGLKAAKYPIVARMDGDDIALPKRLEVQLDLLLNTDADIVGTQIQLFSEEFEIGGGYLRYQEWINSQISSTDIETNFWIESCIPHPSAMMAKSLLESLEGYLDTPWPEDYDLWARAHLAGYKFAKPKDQILLKWRDYPERTSRVDQRYNDEQFLRCKAQYLSKLLSQKGVKEVSIWGTGPTGTKLYHLLSEQHIKVSSFVDVNPKLKGRNKLGKPIHIIGKAPTQDELAVVGGMCLIAVRSWGARERIREALLTTGYRELIDFIIVA